VLVGKIYDIRRRYPAACKEKALPPPSLPAVGPDGGPLHLTTLVPGISSAAVQAQQPVDEEAVPTGSSSPAAVDGPQYGDGSQPPSEGQAVSDLGGKPILLKSSRHSKVSLAERKKLDGKLKLQTLELERVALSLHVCRYAIDWTVMTAVTILDCPQHETLWKMLKRQHQPTPVAPGWGGSRTGKSAPPETPLQYHLKLKHIHTDATSPGLLSFIKETLAPNSLEVLFLQDRKRSHLPPQVTVSQIFKSAIKRHRSSLRKLLIDSSQRPNVQGSAAIENNTRWQQWVLPTDVVLYITSGRMSNLREFAGSLDYKDWVSADLQ